MPYSSKAIANYFLKRSKETGVDLSPMKLQKLVYFAHGWNLGLTGEPLVHEQVEAWQYGPVIPSLYYEFKGYGNRPIRRLAQEMGMKPEEGIISFRTETPDLHREEGDEEKLDWTNALLEKIWKVFSPSSAVKLSNMTHLPGTPWEQVVKQHNGNPPKGTDIPQAMIEQYFQSRSSSSALPQESVHDT